MRLLVLTLILASALTQASTPLKGLNRRCFKKHLEDAIKLNKQRMTQYSVLSRGKSEKVSRALIRKERLSIIFGGGIDRKAIKYQDRGLNVICEDFIDMSEAPLFGELMDQGKPDASDFYQYNAKKMKRRLIKLAKLETLPELIEEGRVLLGELAKEKRFNCMFRHLIESIIRSSQVALKYHREALARELDSPIKLSLGFIRNQILSIWLVKKLDDNAKPVQMMGVPIICQDVPHIPEL